MTKWIDLFCPKQYLWLLALAMSFARHLTCWQQNRQDTHENCFFAMYKFGRDPVNGFSPAIVTIDHIQQWLAFPNTDFLFPAFLLLTAFCPDYGDNMKNYAESKAKKQTKIVVSSMISIGMLFLCLAFVLYIWKKKRQKDSMLFNQWNSHHSHPTPTILCS